MTAKAHVALVIDNKSEPLPHQISAVYEAMMPEQPLRFELTDFTKRAQKSRRSVEIAHPLQALDYRCVG